MSEDVVFLLPGQLPMRGKDAFAASFQMEVHQHRMGSYCQVEEIKIAGDWAYCWANLMVTLAPVQGGLPTHYRGNTLTILHKRSGSGWVIARDANLLAPEPTAM